MVIVTYVRAQTWCRKYLQAILWKKNNWNCVKNQSLYTEWEECVLWALESCMIALSVLAAAHVPWFGAPSWESRWQTEDVTTAGTGWHPPGAPRGQALLRAARCRNCHCPSLLSPAVPVPPCALLTRAPVSSIIMTFRTLHPSYCAELLEQSPAQALRVPKPPSCFRRASSSQCGTQSGFIHLGSCAARHFLGVHSCAETHGPPEGPKKSRNLKENT